MATNLLRLTALSRALMPSSLEALRWAGLQRGSRCLDLGCGDGLATQALARAVGRVGRVVGLDANPNVVDAAGKTAAELHDDDAWARVAFVCGHVPDHLEALKGQRFDFVYTRLLLSGLAQPETAVECARSLLWPGGRLLVEDFDYGSAFCHPHSADFDRFTQLQSAAACAELGGLPQIGPRLFSLLQDAGFEDLRVRVVQPVFTPGMEERAYARYELRTLREKALKLGLATETELDTLDAKLKTLERVSDLIVSLPRIFQVTGSSPKQ